MVTDYFKNLIADNLWHTLGDAQSTLPNKYYVALSATEPLPDGTGVSEPQGGTYKRQELTGMSVAQNGTTKNTANVVWAKCETNMGSVSYWALYDAESGGNLLVSGALDGEKHLDAGTTIIFEANSLVLNIVGE